MATRTVRETFQLAGGSASPCPDPPAGSQPPREPSSRVKLKAWVSLTKEAVVAAVAAVEVHQWKDLQLKLLGNAPSHPSATRWVLHIVYSLLSQEKVDLVMKPGNQVTADQRQIAMLVKVAHQEEDQEVMKVL